MSGCALDCAPVRRSPRLDVPAGSGARRPAGKRSKAILDEIRTWLMTQLALPRSSARARRWEDGEGSPNRQMAPIPGTAEVPGGPGPESPLRGHVALFECTAWEIFRLFSAVCPSHILGTPRFLRLTPRTIRYAKADLERSLASCAMEPTRLDGTSSLLGRMHSIIKMVALGMLFHQLNDRL